MAIGQDDAIRWYPLFALLFTLFLLIYVTAGNDEQGEDQPISDTEGEVKPPLQDVSVEKWSDHSRSNEVVEEARPSGTAETNVLAARLLHCVGPLVTVRPESANHQWRKNPSGESSIDPVADERLVWTTAWAGAS